MVPITCRCDGAGGPPVGFCVSVRLVRRSYDSEKGPRRATGGLERTYSFILNYLLFIIAMRLSDTAEIILNKIKLRALSEFYYFENSRSDSCSLKL